MAVRISTWLITPFVFLSSMCAKLVKTSIFNQVQGRIMVQPPLLKFLSLCASTYTHPVTGNLPLWFLSNG